ncbi:MAG: M12 family metallo-peptidase [Chloroflexota bacterium]
MNKFLLILVAEILFGITPLTSATFDGNLLLWKNSGKNFATDGIIRDQSTEISVAEYNLSLQYAEKAFNVDQNIIKIQDFPVSPFERTNIELRVAVSPFDSATKWFMVNERGEELRVSSPAVKVFKGKIEGEDSSEVILVYSNGYLNGCVRSAHGTYFDITSLEKGTVTIAPADLPFKIAGRSVAIESQDYLPVKIDQIENMGLEPAELTFSNLLEAKIIIDATYRFYQKMNNDYDKAAAYIAAVMSYVSIIYERDINVRLATPYVEIRTSSNNDPYFDRKGEKIDKDLNKLPGVWKNKRTEDIAAVCLFANFDYPAGGLSRFSSPGVGLLCDRNWSYCVVGMEENVILPNYNYTWDVSVVAHEIGHLFGAPHTHICYYNPPLDTCVTRPAVPDACLDGNPVPARGTIMSYCHLTYGAVELAFHPRQIPQMRNAALASACIKESRRPAINIISPTVKRAYEPGQEIIIGWSYSKVATVNIYYSTNEGTSWIEIAKNIPAETGEIAWKAPSTPTAKIILKITASADESIWDISDAYLAVIIPYIEIIRPREDEEYGEKETAVFRWEAPLTDSVDIFFSVDAGRNWKLVRRAFFAVGILFNFNGTISDSCRIKVVDAGREWLVAVSPPFKVGPTRFKFLTPKPGDSLCSSSEASVKWESRYLNEVLFEWSSDGGQKWETLEGSVFKGESGGMVWSVPDGFYPRIALRAIMNYHSQNAAIVLATLDHLSIFPCKPDSVQAVKILFVAPNPASEEAIVTIQSAGGNAPITISVYNSIGALALPEFSFTAEGVISARALDLRGLSSGGYFVVVNAGNERSVYPLAVIR